MAPQRPAAAHFLRCARVGRVSRAALRAETRTRNAARSAPKQSSRSTFSAVPAQKPSGRTGAPLGLRGRNVVQNGRGRLHLERQRPAPPRCISGGSRCTSSHFWRSEPGSGLQVARRPRLGVLVGSVGARTPNLPLVGGPSEGSSADAGQNAPAGASPSGPTQTQPPRQLAKFGRFGLARSSRRQSQSPHLAPAPRLAFVSPERSRQR